MAFDIAKLEGNTWMNIIDASNSPINFSLYMGFEIDMHGNLWVIDEDALRTLIAPNSPGWLNTIETRMESFIVYPNPGDEVITIQNSSYPADEIWISDISGKIIQTLEYKDKLEVSHLQSGVYFIQFLSDGQVSGRTRWVKESTNR